MASNGDGSAGMNTDAATGWSAAEDLQLRMMVQAEGAGNWSKKAEAFATARTGDMLRCRWYLIEKEHGASAAAAQAPDAAQAPAAAAPAAPAAQAMDAAAAHGGVSGSEPQIKQEEVDVDATQPFDGPTQRHEGSDEDEDAGDGGGGQAERPASAPKRQRISLDGAAGIKHSATHPKFLHSNSTSHQWAFGAIAELIDNAADPDVDAKKIHISAEALPDHKPALILQDDGNGLDHEGLHKLLSFGYNDKAERFKGTIGRYGNGFKSGSMRLGKDALVFTKHRHGPTMSVGFLSQTFLAAVGADEVLIPMVSWDKETKQAGPLQFSNCVAIHLQLCCVAARPSRRTPPRTWR